MLGKRVVSGCLPLFIILSLFLVPVTPAGAAPGVAPQFAPDRILVKFRPSISAASSAAVHAANGGRVRATIPALDVRVVEVPSGRAQEKARAYKARPEVEYAEPDYVLSAILTPDDPSLGLQWGLERVLAPPAWDVTQGSPDIKIAILDTGVDQDHEDLAAKIVANQNFSASPTVDDLYGHGTHVAGIAAAITNNGTGVAGLGYNATIMNVKVLGDDGAGTDSTVASGIAWAADNGAQVISLSLGGTSYSKLLEEAVNYAWSRGVVIVAAAGNSGSNLPNYPAYYEHCIAVAATSSAEVKSSFSNYGSWVDVAAPGEGIYSTLPNHAHSSSIPGTNYGNLSGTSMATPFVAGLAALVWSTSFGTANAAVRAAIEDTAEHIPGTGDYWTYGRVNAYGAVSGLTPNHPPVLAPVGNQTATVGVPFTAIDLSATDPDMGDTLTYSMTGLPTGATLDPATGVLTWTPTAEQVAGSPYTVTFTVLDGNGGTDSETVTITVTPAPPPSYTLAISIVGQGMVMKNPDQTSYPSGTVVTLTANPATGWSFSGWSGDLSGSTNPTTITMNGNKTVTATFTQVMLVEITKAVAAGPDDGMSGSWGFYSNLSWYELGNPGSAYGGWFRFTGISIPQGATILAARLEVVETSWPSGIALKLSAEQGAAPAAPTSTADRNARVRTSASVAWNAGVADWAYHNSPDISTVIQELVNSRAYDNGVIQLLVDNNGSTGEAVGRTFESGQAPRLYIKYQVGGIAPNHPPVLTPIGNKTGTVGSPLSFTIAATDADGDALTYSAANLPEGAAFTPATRVFNWPEAVEGIYAGVVFSVTDGRSAPVSETISITVSRLNQAPVLDPIGNKLATVGQLLTFTVSATDPEGDPITYGVVNLPAGAEFDPAARTFSWIPAVPGVYTPTFTVSDGHGGTGRTITITVNQADAPQYTLTIIIAGQGTVARSPNQAAYPANAEVVLTATPAIGWAFAGWGGDASGAVSPLTVAMSNNKTVTATFAQEGEVQITKSVAAGTDDGFSGPWGFYSGLGWYEVGNPGQPYNAWYRFTGITIPQGATILEARLEVVQTRWDSGVRLKISADKSATPTAPTTTANHSSKTRTGAGVAWNTGYADSAYHSSPDISAVIQELVNASAYANGVIQLLVDNNGGTGEAVGRLLETGFAPRLYIRYEAGTPPPANHPPVLAAIGPQSGTTGVPLSFTLSATDPDAGDTLTFSAAGLPGGATLDPATGAFAWPVPVAGTYNVTFAVSDGKGGTDSEAVTITVAASSSVVEITRFIVAGADDGFSGPWGFYSGLAWYEAGNPGAAYNAWYRFTGITIPKGATILEASLRVVETRWDSGVRLKISADASPTPTAPASAAAHNAKVRTTASVAWNAGFADWAYHGSPDIAAVIQELVNANAYNDRAIQLLVDNNGSTGEAVGRTYESGQAPWLYIKYQTGSGAARASASVPAAALTLGTVALLPAAAASRRKGAP